MYKMNEKKIHNVLHILSVVCFRLLYYYWIEGLLGCWIVGYFENENEKKKKKKKITVYFIILISLLKKFLIFFYLYLFYF